jgi:hypothetical protein
MRNVKFARRPLSLFAARAGDRDDFRAFDFLKRRNLHRSRKSRPDNPDSDFFSHRKKVIKAKGKSKKAKVRKITSLLLPFAFCFLPL